MINPMDLTGKKILITGASSGIGKETAIYLNSLGATVILVARNIEKLNEVYKILDNKNNSYYSYDLYNIENIEVLFNKMISENGPLDGFVHCAGIAPFIPLKNINYKNIDEVMRINYYSFIEITRLFSLKKNNNNGGSIVGISSIASVTGEKAKISYSASKAALDSSINVLAIELWDKKIRVNTIRPGLIKTDMFDSFISIASEESQNRFKVRQFMGAGSPIDISNIVAFLLSDASSFINGSHINIDGGWLI